MNRLALWVAMQRANTLWAPRYGARLAAASLLAACGGAARYPAADLEPAPQTVDEALRQLANAKHELGIVDASVAINGGDKEQPAATKAVPYGTADLRPQATQPTTPTSGVSPSPASPPRVEAQVTSTEARSGGGDSDAAEERKRAQCINPCRALASIKRASEALCRMTAETDERCISARNTLLVATERTASCACQQ